MPRISEFALRAPDSQVLGSMDSLSFPSEPPDIRNWFSSYAYDSDAFDSIRDLDASSGNLFEEEKKTKIDDILAVEKNNDGLIYGKMESLDGIVKGNVSDELGPHLDSGSPDHISLSSAPLDISLWFSSYVYETPRMDNLDGFIGYKESDEGKMCNAEINSGDNDNVRGFMDVRKNMGLSRHGRMQDVVVRCNGLEKGTHHQNNESVCKDDCKVERQSMSLVLSELKSESDFREVPPGLLVQTVNHRPVKQELLSNEDSKENKAESDAMVFHQATPDLNLLNAEKFSGMQEKNSTPKLQRMEEYANKNLDKECINRNRNTWRSATAGRTGKENDSSSSPGNGFVSTRKPCKFPLAFNECLTAKPQGGQYKCKVKDAEPAINRDKDTNIRRQVLSETTNIHVPNSLETPGKWRCPQLNKANHGPPLKQIRLDQWVRRL